VSLKVYTCQEANWGEFEVYKRLNQGNSSHPGYGHVRKALGIFTIPRAGGDHYCLVQKPTWESFRDLLYRNPIHRFTEELLKAGLKQVFLALDYLHTECQLVHTGGVPFCFQVLNLLTNLIDIKGDNILQEIEDISILDAFTKPKWTTLLHGNLSATHRCMLLDGSNCRGNLGMPS
jgi:serine/threonine-protein kinase SRPK3